MEAPPVLFNVLTTEEQLKAALAPAVRDVLDEVLPEIVRRALAKPYYTKAELMELTGWSARQVEYKKAQRELAYVKRGRLVLFPTEAVHAYLEAGRVPARRRAS